MKRIFLYSIFVLSLCLAYALKRPCQIHSWGGEERFENSNLCYNDIQALYELRGLNQRKIPYVEARPYEYPPLIASQMYLTSWASKDNVQFFYANLWVNSLWLLLSLLVLETLQPNRKKLFYFAGVPTLVLYAFFNWDASSVLLLCLSMYFYEGKKEGGAACCAAMAFAGKLFPVLCLIPMALAAKNDFVRLKKIVLGALLGFAVFYLPLIVASIVQLGNFGLVTSIFQFHAKRLPEFATFWHWTSGIFGYSPFEDGYRVFVERVSAFLMIAGVLLVSLSKNKKRTIWTQSGALVALLLLVSKIYSPQYALWLLPFFVLNSTSWKAIFAFLVGDLWGFIAIFTWFAVTGKPDEVYWKYQLQWAVLFRSSILFYLFLSWGFFPKRSVLLKKTGMK